MAEAVKDMKKEVIMEKERAGPEKTSAEEDPTTAIAREVQQQQQEIHRDGTEKVAKSPDDVLAFSRAVHKIDSSLE